MRAGALSLTAALPQLFVLAQQRGGRPLQSHHPIQKPRPGRAARRPPSWLLPARLEVRLLVGWMFLLRFIVLRLQSEKTRPSQVCLPLVRCGLACAVAPALASETLGDMDPGTLNPRRALPGQLAGVPGEHADVGAWAELRDMQLVGAAAVIEDASFATEPDAQEQARPAGRAGETTASGKGAEGSEAVGSGKGGGSQEAAPLYRAALTAGSLQVRHGTDKYNVASSEYVISTRG